MSSRLTASFPFRISWKTSSIAWQRRSIPQKSMEADIPLRECAALNISAIAVSEASVSRTRRFLTIISWFSRDSAM